MRASPGELDAVTWRRVRAAWGRLLDPHSRRALPERGRLEVERERTGSLTLVRLGGALAPCGPPAALARTRGVDESALCDHTSHTANMASASLAARLGLVSAGTQTTVLLE